VARAILALGAVIWLLAAGVGIGLARLGVDRLLALLPPLSIDADAVGGALTAIAIALGGIGLAQVVILFGLRRGGTWARTAGVLLSAVLSMVSLALGAAALASAVRDASSAAPLLVGAGGATLAAVGYAVAAIGLAQELGSDSVH
jgi:hypothetical protein